MAQQGWGEGGPPGPPAKGAHKRNVIFILYAFSSNIRMKVNTNPINIPSIRTVLSPMALEFKWARNNGTA